MRDFIKACGITVDQFYGRKPVHGHIVCDKVDEVPDDFSPVVYGNLTMNRVRKVGRGFAPRVLRCRELFRWTADLHLDSLENFADGFSPDVDGSIYLPGIRGSKTWHKYHHIELCAGKNIVFGDALTVLPDGTCVEMTAKGNIYFPAVRRMSSMLTGIFAYGDVHLPLLEYFPRGYKEAAEVPILVSEAKKSLHLESLKELPEGFQVNLKGDLWLNSLRALPEKFAVQVKGSLHLSGPVLFPADFRASVKNIQIEPEETHCIVPDYDGHTGMGAWREKFCEEFGLTLGQFFRRAPYEGNLNLSECTVQTDQRRRNLNVRPADLNVTPTIMRR